LLWAPFARPKHPLFPKLDYSPEGVPQGMRNYSTCQV
jgi:hypothetical protein